MQFLWILCSRPYSLLSADNEISLFFKKDCEPAFHQFQVFENKILAAWQKRTLNVELILISDF